MISTVLITLALLIIAGLGFYAGKMLYLLRRQTVQQNNRRQARLRHIIESIQTIAMAMEQQQCNISEGCIRLCMLLDSLPIEPLPDYRAQFPALHDLYQQIKDMPTHEDRQKQLRTERVKMDLVREELEAKAETAILKEVAVLRHFCL
ncbi:DUF2489 domain-containing protein [Neptunicella sp. SCSIO 80796]|uniref:DUF2489 domain-containing protein n=1 Tax=Neptunicella plasticusilytica TaxID=3117012 RepID=UPI003A4E60F3